MGKNDEKSRRKKFGEWLQAERLAIISPATKKPLSQVEAAERTGGSISRVQWARIESGASGTKYTTIPIIARGIGYNSPEQLAEVYRRAGFASDQEAIELPSTMAKQFMALPVEAQRDIARLIAQRYELETLKSEKRGKR